MSSSTYTSEQTQLPHILQEQQGAILDAWVREQLDNSSSRRDLIDDATLRQQSKTLLTEIASALRAGSGTDPSGSEWAGTRSLLTEISRARAAQGFKPTETATFVLSLRGVLMDRLQAAYGKDAAGLSAEMRLCSTLIDKLALLTTDAALEAREQTIRKQQEEMLELSTPVVRLFPGVLGLPLIGTLDSARTQVVMENLLQQIVETESTIAIIDITGVPTVDTLVAQHLLKAVAATRLMGADCIISGIRPQIAQTIVQLGVELRDVTTRATLADGLKLALERLGMSVHKNKEARKDI